MKTLSSRLLRFRFAKVLVLTCVTALVGLVACTCSATSANGSDGDRFVLKPIPFSAVHHSGQAPRLRNANGTSSNWSGYAALGIPASTHKPKKPSSPLTFIDAAGSWVVPDVVSTTSSSTYSSSWVGIDGYSTNTVEQIGTEQDWSDGSPVYYAWFELYPKVAYEIVGFPVNPDDTISAEVAYLGNSLFRLTIANVTQDVSFSTTQKLNSAKRLSAEWIQEAPSGGGVLPLADFGVIGFSGCSATLDNGHNGSISDSAWGNDPITMQTSNGTVKAEPSALSAGGTSFSVRWEHE